MNELLVTGIEQELRVAELVLAGQQRRVEQLQADLAEAKKPMKFQPFSVVIQVQTLEQALGLRELSFWPATIAQAIEDNEAGKFGEIATAMALLSVLRKHINDEGHYQA